MNMYVLQVKSGFEETATAALEEKGFSAFCPSQEVYIRHGGQWHKKLKLVFTQYVFIECELDDKAYYQIKSVVGVVRFLGCGNPEPLQEHEKRHLLWLYNGGEPIESSKIYVTTSGDYMILSGLLREYPIDKIDLRQRRAKITVPFCGKDHKVTLPVIGI